MRSSCSYCRLRRLSLFFFPFFSWGKKILFASRSLLKELEAQELRMEGKVLGPNASPQEQSPQRDPRPAPNRLNRPRSPRAPPCDVTVPTMVLAPLGARRTGRARAGCSGPKAWRQLERKPARGAGRGRAGAAGSTAESSEGWRTAPRGLAARGGWGG